MKIELSVRRARGHSAVMKDVFISYATPDRESAERIAAFLESKDVSVWIAPRDVPPGADYGDAIIAAIENARSLVLVLSEGALESVYVSREVERAVAKGKPVFPVRIRDVAPSGSLEFFIASAQWVDAFRPPLENHLLPLVQAVKGEAPTAASSAPARPRRRGPVYVAVVAVVAAIVLPAAYLLRKSPPADGTFYAGHWCERIGQYVVRWEVVHLAGDRVQTQIHHPAAPSRFLPNATLVSTEDGLRLEFEASAEDFEPQVFTVLDENTIRREQPTPADGVTGIRKRCLEGDEGS